MLLPWRKPARLVLSPDALILHIGKRVLSHQINTPVSNSAEWFAEVADVLSAEHSALQSYPLKIILSNSFVRYQSVAWRPGIYKTKDWQAIAENQFKQLMGNAFTGFKVQLMMQAYGQPVLAVAIEKGLIQQLELMAQRQGWRLDVIEPAFVTVVNAYRGRLKKDCFLLLTEPQRLLLAQSQNNAWQLFTVAIPPAGDELNQIEALLQQLSLQKNVAESPTVFVYGERDLRLPAQLASRLSISPLPVKQSDTADLALSYGGLI